MGWPRKDESCRLYLEKSDKSYLIVIVDEEKRNHYDAIGNFQVMKHPCVCSCSASPTYLRNCCKRVQWSDLPSEWKKAFLAVMKDWDEKNPKNIRGFWKLK